MLLIFDCDGVLVDSETLHAHIEAAIGRELLGIQRTDAEHHARFSGGGLKNLYLAWEQETGNPLSPEIDQEMERRKNEVFATQLKAMPNMAEALEQTKNTPRCIATGTPLPTLEVALHATGLYDFFAPHFFTADMVKRGKPAPDVFLYAAERMNAKPQDCIVIEDSVKGVQAGVAANMRVFGFAGGSHCKPGFGDKLKAAGADLVFADMHQLPRLMNG